MSWASTTIRSTQPVPWAIDVAAAQVAVADGLLQQRPEQVEHVRADSRRRPGSRRTWPAGSTRGASPPGQRTDGGTEPDGTCHRRPARGGARRPGRERASPAAYDRRHAPRASTSATRNITLGLFRAGALLGARAGGDEPAVRRRTSWSCCWAACSQLDGTLDRRHRRDLARIGRARPDRGRRGDRAATRPGPGRRRRRQRAARDPGRSARRGRRGPAGQRRSRRPACTARRLSSSTSGRPPRSTASPPTAPTSAARSHPAWSWAWRRSPPGPPSCPGSSCARRTGRSAATRSRPCRRARSSATRRSPAACWSGSGDELAETSGVAPGDVKAILTGGLSAAPWAARCAASTRSIRTSRSRASAILHAEVGGGEPLELDLA